MLIYASKFINALPNTPNNIDISDIDGFTDLVQSARGKSNSIDVMLHSPGGQPDATERIVHILRNNFEEVHFIVPHSAYSAATMLALSGDSITLHPSATLGPIDPQINGTTTRSIKRGFDKVKKLKDLKHYQHIFRLLKNIHLTFLRFAKIQKNFPKN